MGPLASSFRRLAPAVILWFFLQAAASATTYYIDYAAGSNANNGTSKTTPWQHMPGMQGCTASCASAVPKSGDRIILKGGVTWPNAAFPILWTWSGSSGSPIYIGVDQTWYAGAVWTRPIFDAGGVPISGSYNMFIRAISISYLTIDNVEMKGINWSSPPSYGGLAYISTNGTYVTISNCYIHGWSHTGGVTTDGLQIVLGSTSAPYNSGSVITHCVFDGSDSTNGGDSGSATYAWPSVTYSIFHDMANAVLATGHGEIGNNLIYNIKVDFDPTMHENGIELIGSDGGTFYIHDNVLHDIVAEVMFLGTSPVAYVWNNVVYNSLTTNNLSFDIRYNSTTIYYLNNTVVASSGGTCFIQTGSTYASAIILQNNHCITTGALDNISSPVTATRTANVVQSPSVSSGQGYTSAEAYVYSPTSGSGATVGQGANAASVWPSGFSTNDTTYTCTQNVANQSVCPARTPIARSTTWDIGAYLYSGSGAAPAAPTGLSAIVQ